MRSPIPECGGSPMATFWSAVASPGVSGAAAALEWSQRDTALDLVVRQTFQFVVSCFNSLSLWERVGERDLRLAPIIS